MVRIFTVVHTDLVGADVLYATKDPERVVEALREKAGSLDYYERQGHGRATMYVYLGDSLFDRYLIRSHTHPDDRCDYRMDEWITRRERPST